jgi:hypothetical protein
MTKSLKFLKLLDPRGVTAFGPGPTIAERARAAHGLFPQLVKQSRLRYWRPGDAVEQSGARLLIALAPTYSLMDLRFADVLNEALATRQVQDVVVDVFAIDDIRDVRQIGEYYPGLKNAVCTPIAGLWNHGRLEGIHFAGNAINFVFRYLRIDHSAERVSASVRPPAADLLDG